MRERYRERERERHRERQREREIKRERVQLTIHDRGTQKMKQFVFSSTFNTSQFLYMFLYLVITLKQYRIFLDEENQCCSGWSMNTLNYLCTSHTHCTRQIRHTYIYRQTDKIRQAQTCRSKTRQGQTR